MQPAPPPGPAATYTITLSYGDLMTFLAAMASQTGAFRHLAATSFFIQLVPTLGESVTRAAQHIDTIVRPVVYYLAERGIVRPDAPTRPADETPVHLTLETGQLQLLGELSPLCVTTWQALLDGLPRVPMLADLRARVLAHRKQAEEGAAAMLLALATAGVPPIPGLHD